MASQPVPHGKRTCGGAFARKKLPRRLKAYALEADYEFARQSLAAAVARAYFSTIEAAQQEANAQDTLDIYQEYSKLTDVRKEQGFASDFDVSQIKSRTVRRRGCALRRTGGAGADDPRDRGRHQSLPGRQV